MNKTHNKFSEHLKGMLCLDGGQRGVRESSYSLFIQRRKLEIIIWDLLESMNLQSKSAMGIPTAPLNNPLKSKGKSTLFEFAKLKNSCHSLYELRSIRLVDHTSNEVNRRIDIV